MLFWDKAVIPKNNGMSFGNSPEMDFLVSCDFLEQPFFGSSGELATIVAQSYADCFTTLEAKEPGKWATAGPKNAAHFAQLNMSKQRGALVNFANAVPIPDRDVPLENVFEFKFRRKDELDLLRLEMDSFFESWLIAEDKDHQLQSTTKRIEIACNELVRTAKEAKSFSRVSSLAVGYSLSAISVYSLYEFAKSGVFDQNLLNIGTAIGGTLAGVTMSRETTPNASHWKSSPYRYAFHMDRELF